MTEAALRVEDTRGLAQGEIFLLTEKDGHFDAIVYNTLGFGSCPKELFEAIDVDKLAADSGADRAWKNPRRYWMMDRLIIDIAGEPAELQGVKFNLLAKMQMPAGFDPQRDQSAFAYQPTQIHRVNTYEFRAGRPVFLLRAPDGVTWVMQTYTDHVDPTLTESDLPQLGARLALPEGWQFKAATLEKDLTITTTGVADVMPDDLANMYQGCLAGVNNFDPWA